MQRDLVDERRWISRQDYLDGLALAQLAPALSRRNSRCTWATCAPARWAPRSSRVCFILPSFLMVWAISVAYVRFGGLPWMQALFYGVGAAVIGIIARSAHKLTRLTLGRRLTLWIDLRRDGADRRRGREREIVWLFVLAGVVTAGLAMRGLRERRNAGGQSGRLSRSPVPPARDAGRSCRRWPTSSGSSRRRERSYSAAAWRSCRSCTASSSRPTAG